VPDHRRKANELDASEIDVHFSPRVTQAFRDLAAAVHFSEHFDGDIRRIVQDWAQGKPKTVHGVLIALPSIAGETFRHIAATGDERAQEAWDEIGSQMNEKGFTLTKARVRGK
jgi:hypothetical protein